MGADLGIQDPPVSHGCYCGVQNPPGVPRVLIWRYRTCPPPPGVPWVLLGVCRTHWCPMGAAMGVWDPPVSHGCCWGDMGSHSGMQDHQFPTGAARGVHPPPRVLPTPGSNISGRMPRSIPGGCQPPNLGCGDTVSPQISAVMGGALELGGWVDFSCWEVVGQAPQTRQDPPAGARDEWSH